MFRKLDLFPSSGEEKDGSLGRANLSQWTSLPPLTWTWEQPISQLRVFHLFKIPNDGQSPQSQWFWFCGFYFNNSTQFELQLQISKYL
jgi:hypothetical protein